MKKRIITLSGIPGSGKTTVRRLIANRLNYKTFSTGKYVREMAHSRQLSLEEFNKLMIQDKSFDLSVDEKLKSINDHENNYVVDSHLAFHFVPFGFNVYLKISSKEAAKRIYSDSHSKARVRSGEIMNSIEAATKHIHWRIQNNIDRYKRLYNFNPYIENQYKYCIDVENISPEEITDKIIEAYNKWLDV